MLMATIIYAIETIITFLFEKHSELYMKYSEASIAKEKVIIVQEFFWSFWLCQKAERNGA